jgi:multidrug efflux system membrane fusion protein
VNARLLVNTMQSTVRVPVPAVQRGEPGTFVYLINANNTVSVRAIKVGPTDGSFEAVLSGLEPGDRVVTDGTDRLRDGAPVTLPAAQKGQPQAGGRPAGASASTSPAAAAPGQTPPAATPEQPADPNAQHAHHRQPQAQ